MAKMGNVREKRTRKQDVFIDRLMRITHASKQGAEVMASTASATSFWINPLRGEPDETLGQLKALGVQFSPIDWLPHAFSLQSEKLLLSDSELFSSGRVFIQNLSSMIAVHALDPQPGDHVLDVCASPGGKSARAASLTNNEIHLWANDSIKPRVTKMQSVFDQFGVKPETITAHPGQYVDKFIDAKFDRIMLDAQCSGEARIDISRPGTMRFWSEERVREMSFLQQRMLVSAWKLLKPGGVLVYSTCTYAPEENESPVSFLLQHHPDADIEPIKIPLRNTQEGLRQFDEMKFDPRLSSALRILPSESNEAFFVCRLRKRT